MMTTLRNAALLSLPSATALLASDAGGHDGGDPLLTKKFINFGILAIGIGYLVVKSLVPALRGQQKDILDKLNQASKRADAAAARAAEIDRKMAGLDEEVRAIREAASRDMQAEAVRFQNDTAVQAEKIQHAAEAEMASAVKAARQELKAYSAQLAVDLARQKISAQLDEGSQERLVTTFAARIAEGKGSRN